MSQITKFLKGGFTNNNLSTVADIQKDTGQERIVIGFATLNNVDLTNEMITEKANLKAFSEFRGNVRIMHEKRPVGKMIEYAPASFYDEKTNTTYEGVKVAVKISKAAEDVWEMCLDGTLSGFSVGGSVRQAGPEYQEELNKTVRVINDYQLLELSLVDSPANHLANVHTIYKSIDGQPEGAAIQLGGDFIKVFQQETKGDNPEMADTENTTPAEVSEVVTTETVINEETTAPVEAVADEAEATTETETAEVTEEVKAEAEVSSEAPELTALIAQLTEQLAAYSKDSLAVAKTLEESVDAKIAEIAKSVDARFAEIAADTEKSISPIASLTAKLDQIEAGIAKTEKQLDSMNEASAMQKSLEAETVTETVDEDASPFAGLFSDRYK